MAREILRIAACVSVLLLLQSAAASLAWGQDALGLIPSEGAATPLGEERVIPVAHSAGEDQALTLRLAEIFAQVDGLSDIVINVQAGVVVLSGETVSNRAHQKAVTIAKQLQGVVDVQDEISESRDLGRRLNPLFSDLRERLVGLLLGLPLFGASLATFLLFVLLGRLVSRWQGIYRRLSRNPFARDLARQAVRLVFIAVGAAIALEILDATAVVAAVAGFAGLVGLAVSFAFRDLAENYIASVLLSLRQPFQADEHVIIEGHEGHIVRLTSRATILINLDGNHVRIPNATVFKGTILNFSRNPQRRFSFEVGVASSESLSHALHVGVTALQASPGVLAAPSATGWVSNLGDWSVTLCFSAWIDQRETHWWKARGESIRLVKEAFDAAAISIPDPILSVYGVVSDKPATMESTSPEVPPAPDRPPKIDISPDSEIAPAAAQDRASSETDLLDASRPRE